MALDIQLWTEAGVTRALRGGYATLHRGDGSDLRDVLLVLPSDTSPADGSEAARRYFGSDDVAFSHLAMRTYPAYRLA